MCFLIRNCHYNETSKFGPYILEEAYLELIPTTCCVKIGKLQKQFSALWDSVLSQYMVSVAVIAG